MRLESRRFSYFSGVIGLENKIFSDNLGIFIFRDDF